MKHLLFRAFGAALVLASATAAIAAEQAGDPPGRFLESCAYLLRDLPETSSLRRKTC